MTNLPVPFRDPAPMLERALQDWGGHADLWVFGYGSLIWRPDFDYVERRAAKVHGWHRALKMWSRVNRGTPQCPGLVFGMLSGGSCRGMVFRVDRRDGRQVMIDLWQREMVTAVYDPRWLSCQTLHGPVRALAFTLSRKSPQHAGELPDHEYRRIFEQACGRFGSTRAYAQTTFDALRKHGIHDRALARLIALTRTEA
ncbi:gamma-glutamylcyclotransferase [Verminephrobacter aporrectodeae]|uniref:gamma-glutamylcyclotransferase n=1 Tax=Verminephrobacter aporrectodeae TaxID=1110389 RepID=UPI0002375479|nr:gamma-glutamylcyclotransferase [Verminephrobacter aporrectodeae]MCW8166735.1 gamma-glutamylcyclotransferase [Verminephrobacter aporrectodeae subsp. tuberculatae]MCW8169048.1 gamma-glutamylcyclotransferase [Verminephrobacter aporrectodeae subsp. tuberculatae]MCW8177361.1 gamma-glutamylcyclotransferase [Verminephrobacter aporrectodeae subsp. tuberculatae]MCW8204784.1 gamma-glutamylcyclotransferase [Verminephrobacter aporrectodeae subsp. tuberculatae]MCW8209022.1 gamma-glutamylcyclotransferase